MIDFSQAIEQVRSMANSVIQFIPNLIVAILVILLFILIGRLIRATVTRTAARYENARNVSVVFGRLAQWLIVLAGILVGAIILFPSISPGDVLNLLGIGSVAIGFAFRDILQNFLAGIILLLTQPFRIGDQIKVGDLEGTVENIETRATMIRTYDARRIVIPNSTLFTSSVTVNTAFEKRRVEYDFGIGYGDDIAEAKRVVLEALNESPGILADPVPEVLTYELADFSVVLRVRWWIDPPRRADALDSRDKVLEIIKNKLVTNGIDLPFPTYQLLFHDQTEDSDGDRSLQREGWPALQGNVDSNPRPRWAVMREFEEMGRERREKERTSAEDNGKQ
jgi:small conductance mechanosensitive channel